MARIVIIGAGPAGLGAMQTFANSLKPGDNTEIVILEKSKFYYHAVGTPRAYTEESFAKNLFVPYDNVIPAKAKSFVKFIRAVATSISADSNEVSYATIGANDQPSESTTKISFDYLIIATGSSYTVPIKQDPKNFSRAYTEQKLREVREQIVTADKILIVGGGAVGCEVAGDIASHFPNKQVTILSAQDKLVAGDNVKDKFRTKLGEALKALKVNVILGERLEKRLAGNVFSKTTVRTNKGTVIEADIQLLCAGFSPAAELVEAMDPSLVDSYGSIKVNDKFQLDHPRYSHVFAIGDVVNHKTPKMAFYAGEQGKHLANEITAVLRKKQAKVTKAFPPVAVQALILPLGPDGGVSQLPMFGGWVVGNGTTKMFKAKDMMAGRIWGSLGATLPQ